MAFKDDLISDLTEFLNSDEFATDISFKGATIKGIFDIAFETIDLDTGAVEGTQPQVIVKSSDVESLLHDDKLIISGVNYYVTGIQPDGTGITRILLSRDKQ